MFFSNCRIWCCWFGCMGWFSRDCPSIHRTIQNQFPFACPSSKIFGGRKYFVSLFERSPTFGKEFGRAYNLFYFHSFGILKHNYWNSLMSNAPGWELLRLPLLCPWFYPLSAFKQRFIFTVYLCAILNISSTLRIFSLGFPTFFPLSSSSFSMIFHSWKEM
jgi:hypothetical protein